MNKVHPEWLKVRLPTGNEYFNLKEKLRQLKLNTVCEEARCPNIGECWGNRTATIMILGDICTRGCRFCSVTHGNPKGIYDKDEPQRVAEAISYMNLKYVVITSVDRDDLDDGGAKQFYNTVSAVKAKNPHTKIEILIPDFQGKKDSLELVCKSKPSVISHNIETVRRLTPIVRDRRASYELSLFVLNYIKEYSSEIITKSGLMLGLGETSEEVIEALKDLRNVGCDIVTIGQYLQPSKKNLPVERYVLPTEFDNYAKIALEMGFIKVSSGPLVRSSYRSFEGLPLSCKDTSET